MICDFQIIWFEICKPCAWVTLDWWQVSIQIFFIRNSKIYRVSVFGKSFSVQKFGDRKSGKVWFERKKLATHSAAAAADQILVSRIFVLQIMTWSPPHLPHTKFLIWYRLTKKGIIPIFWNFLTNNEVCIFKIASDIDPEIRFT